MEFSLDRLQIHKVGEIWRVAMVLDGVKHLTDKGSLLEGFEALHKDRLSSDFRERLNKFKGDWKGTINDD